MARASEQDRDEALAVWLQPAVEAGWPVAELDATVEIESGWDPTAWNPDPAHPSDPNRGASGIFQAMPGTLRALHFDGTPEAFRLLDAPAQAAVMAQFYERVPRPWRQPGDTYLAVAAPAALGEPDDHEVYAQGSKAWERNPGWRGPDGRITAGSIRAVLLRRLARPGNRPLPKPQPDRPKPRPRPRPKPQPLAVTDDSWKAAALLIALAILADEAR